MEWIVEAETLSDLIDHGRYSIASQPLIRCKDCKEGTYSSDCTIICKYLNNAFSPDDYCSYGERRENA